MGVFSFWRDASSSRKASVCIDFIISFSVHCIAASGDSGSCYLKFASKMFATYTDVMHSSWMVDWKAKLIQVSVVRLISLDFSVYSKRFGGVSCNRTWYVKLIASHKPSRESLLLTILHSQITLYPKRLVVFLCDVISGRQSMGAAIPDQQSNLSLWVDEYDEHFFFFLTEATSLHFQG